MEIDHLAVTCAALDEGVAWAEARLGLALAPGGRHERFGTWNRLLSLGPGLYLEVIAPEPGTAPGRPRWFALDQAGAPRLATWVARVPDLAARPPEGTEVLALARGPYAWTIAVAPDGRLAGGGTIPSLIEWAPGAHPADALPDVGARLVRLELAHPDPDALRRALVGLADPRVVVAKGPAPSLRATLATPHGEVTL